MDLNIGEGKIVELGQQKVGIYKDEHGTLFEVDAACTFEGCTVEWDDNEKVYICPCCGSRYSYDGKVLKGPANEALPKTISDKN